MSCSAVIECPKCAIPLIYHSATGSHRCHYCNYEIKNLTTCPECKEEGTLENFGTGTQRVEEIAGKFSLILKFKDLIPMRFQRKTNILKSWKLLITVKSIF